MVISDLFGKLPDEIIDSIMKFSNNCMSGFVCKNFNTILNNRSWDFELIKLKVDKESQIINFETPYLKTANFSINTSLYQIICCISDFSVKILLNDDNIYCHELKNFFESYSRNNYFQNGRFIFPSLTRNDSTKSQYWKVDIMETNGVITTPVLIIDETELSGKNINITKIIPHNMNHLNALMSCGTKFRLTIHAYYTGIKRRLTIPELEIKLNSKCHKSILHCYNYDYVPDVCCYTSYSVYDFKIQQIEIIKQKISLLDDDKNKTNSIISCFFNQNDEY